MSWSRSKMFALVAVSLATAALLGGSLGMAFAGTATLTTGFNLVGGPTQGDVAPADWVACLPTTSWNAVYIWDATHQTWMHYFNTANVPKFVNASSNGGITVIPRFSGVALIMTQAVNNAKLKDAASQTCS